MSTDDRVEEASAPRVSAHQALAAEEIENMIRANAAAVALPIAPEHLPGVRTYLALAAQMAALVDGLELGRHDESGSHFLPVSPGNAGAATGTDPSR